MTELMAVTELMGVGIREQEVDEKPPESSPGGSPFSARASWLSAMMSFAPLSLLAEFLITRTHHRPLGAATFASAAALLWIFAEVTSRRHLDPAVGRTSARNRKIAWVISSAFTSLVLVRVFL